MRNLKVIPSRNEMTLFLVGGWKPPTRDDFVKEIYQLVCGENTVESCQWMDTGLKLNWNIRDWHIWSFLFQNQWQTNYANRVFSFLKAPQIQ